MRILYFTRDYTPHDHRFLSALAKTEHEIFYLRLERGSRQVEDRPIPVEVQQVRWKGGQRPARWRDFPALWLDLKRVLSEVRPDVVHAGPMPNVAFLAALSGFHPLVSMSWGSDLLRDVDQDRRLEWATRFALRRTDVLVGDCQAVQKKAAQLGFPAERTVLFPWGVDLDQFSPGPGTLAQAPGPEDELRQRSGWDGNFVLLSLRSWEPVYGVDVIARGFALAAQQIPELRLALLGNGSQAKTIREILRHAGIESQVFFGGQVPNDRLVQFYRAADLYLSASHSDGSSVSLMEALACGLPVLVSDIPGNREWIGNEPDGAGWLFRDGDADALAQGIIRAYTLRDENQACAGAARRLAETRADWNQNFLKLLEAYQMAVTRNSGG